jgi:bifunctional non-homologous end joining protein LigD
MASAHLKCVNTSSLTLVLKGGVSGRNESYHLRLTFAIGEKPFISALYSWVVPLPIFQPLALDRARAAFSHPDWLFEIKWDGFRALARIDHGRCKLISRNGNEFQSFKPLSTGLGECLQAQSAILDGEIVCLDDHGKPQFSDLLFRRGEPRFIAFDLLWCDGQDLRYAPLIERKQRLRAVLPRDDERIIYCDHVEADGEQLFQLACENDLEGIVAKRKFDPYLPGHTKWLPAHIVDQLGYGSFKSVTHGK